MKPTCANITSAKAIVTVRKPTSRSACARICADDCGFAFAAACQPWCSGGRPTASRITGTSSTSMAPAVAYIAVANPTWLIMVTSSGTPTMPPKLAPFSARLIAMPRLWSNHRLIVLVIMARLVPAQPKASTASAR
ncbi:hypothetical protein ACVI1J_004484 [Bradyrhizobium diazoefficiens]